MGVHGRKFDMAAVAGEKKRGANTRGMETGGEEGTRREGMRKGRRGGWSAEEEGVC